MAEGKAGGRVTIKDVADAAGVSRSTTSRALTGRGYVAENVRRRVQSAAKRLGYVPDAVARSLKQRHSPVIGVLVSDLSNAFYAELAAGASHRIRQHNLGVLLADTAGEQDGEASAAEMFVSMRVAGVLVTPVGRAVVETLTSASVPTVEVDRFFAPELADSVSVSNARGAADMTSLLLEMGHSDIVLLLDETDWITGQRRLDGFRQALASAGLEVPDDAVVKAGWDVDAAMASTTEVLRRRRRPTAIFAANNVLAEGAWRAINAAGLSIPDEISLAAFDEAPWMSMVTPQITTVGQDAHQLGDAAATLLLNRMNDLDRTARSVELSTNLVRRGSVAPAPKQYGP